jgi:hypothetical protein
MVKLHSLAELGCACCGSVDDAINAEVAKFGAVPLTKFAVHFTPSSTGKDEVRHVSAPTPDAARKAVAEAFKPSTIFVKKIKRST